MKFLLALASAGAGASLLIGCGADDRRTPVAAARPLTAAQARPAAAVAPGTLAGIADGEVAHRRIGYVNVAALRELGGVDETTVARLVLGAGAARLAAAEDAPTTATQIGPATVLSGRRRTVVGGPTELRERLADPNPQPNLIEDETPSAVQSCLGDPAAETILGSSVLGSRSAIGVGLVTGGDAPSGPKLIVCAAPHMYRDVHRIEQRLQRLFPEEGLAPARRPVIGEQEIGERGLMAAAVGLEQVEPDVLRELLSGGGRLAALGAAGPAGSAGDDHGPH